MHFTQYYLDCLSQASYLIGDETSGQAVVVDPRRDIEEYLEDARANGLTIVGVILTHFHADFVSGHLEMADATGAWIGMGEGADPEFEIRVLADGEGVSLGDVTLEIMATPGHTPESVSVVVYEHENDEVAYGVLTGDALFIGDVGRPDLLTSVGTSAEELAKQLYHSVQTKLMGLDDAVRVFPAHGAGSACGKNLSTEKQSTIGRQRSENYACRPMTEAEFVDVVTEGQPTQPGYFAFNASFNKQERPIREPGDEVPALNEDQVRDALGEGAVVHDARPAADYTVGHLKGSLSVPFDGRMAETVGSVLKPSDPIIIMAPDGQEQEIAMRLRRIGYDEILGYIPQPEAYLSNHPDSVQQASRLTVPAASAAMSESVQFLDIRNPGELDAGGIPGAINIPLPQLEDRYTELDPDRPVVIYCAGGWRSSVAASSLRRHGFADVSDILGGFGAWQQLHVDA